MHFVRSRHKTALRPSLVQSLIGQPSSIHVGQRDKIILCKETIDSTDLKVEICVLTSTCGEWPPSFRDVAVKFVSVLVCFILACR